MIGRPFTFFIQGKKEGFKSQNLLQLEHIDSYQRLTTLLSPRLLLLPSHTPFSCYLQIHKKNTKETLKKLKLKITKT